MRLKKGMTMKKTKNLQTKILLLLASVYLILGNGCAYEIVKKRGDIVLPEGEVSISHPTQPGLECWPTGYIGGIMDDIKQCLGGDDGK